MNFAEFYPHFNSPLSTLNCGDRCGPHNEGGAPFCCDTRHAVPSAYQTEWEFLRNHTDLWHIWQNEQPAETERLRRQTPEGQVLIECLGYRLCQRGYRSIVCRAFPFFPYLSRQGEFLGMSYYWEYEDRCWIISNLQVVTLEYRTEFIQAYDAIFAEMPEERENFRRFSGHMRQVFGRRGRAVPLLHRNGHAYKITPRNGRLRRTAVEALPSFGVYKIAAELPFPDEVL
jgi:hypothetical protein